MHWSDGGGVGEACILFCPTPGAAEGTFDSISVTAGYSKYKRP